MLNKQSGDGEHNTLLNNSYNIWHRLNILAW